MQKLILIVLLSVSTGALADTPAARMMPDGSRDMYVGLGVVSAPRYKGSSERDTDPVALVQVQWSNGIFLSGLSLGMHLSPEPTVEYGPLLAIEPGRHASGSQKLSGVDGIGGASVAAPGSVDMAPQSASALRFSEVSSRPVAGGFFNYYLDESLRLTSSLLYGAGEDRNGLLLQAGVQKSLAAFGPHHRVAVSAGVTLANRHYTQDYFGVRPVTGSAGFAPSSGVRDIQLTLNWNWELSRLWLLSSQVSALRLMGDAADSPLTARRNNIAVRTGLAYRF